MLCPNCGTRTTTNEHKFCRNCGMNLEPVARALAAHLSHGGGAPATTVGREADRGTAPEALGCLLAGFFVIILGVLLTVFLSGIAFKLVGIAVAVIGLIAMLVSIFSVPRPKEEAGAEAPPDALDEAAATTNRLLNEQTFQPAQSVTERTTDLLNVEARRRKPQE